MVGWKMALKGISKKTDIYNQIPLNVFVEKIIKQPFNRQKGEPD